MIEQKSDLKDLIKVCLDTVNILDDATFLITKEKKEESKLSEASGMLFNVLLNYVQKLKMEVAKKRNLLQAYDLAACIKIDQIFSSRHEKLKSELRPQNIVRFIEKALKA